MTTVIFIHGTGGRTPRITAMFEQIERTLHERRSDLIVVPCFWGDTLGTKLHAHGASIPLYDTTRGIGDVEDEYYEIALWEQLYRDPLYELRMLSLRSGKTFDFIPGQIPPWEELDNRVKTLPASPILQAKLHEMGIADVFETSRLTVVNSLPYREALLVASEAPNECRLALGRAIIAQTIVNYEQQEQYVTILTNAALRDEIVQLLTTELGGTERGLGSWVAKQLFGLAVAMGAMDHVRRRRGAITDAVYPFAGDVLFYQGRGVQIRTCIREYIQQAEPPVVLLAHSLGGIACVDLLVEEPLPQVRLLVTVGSQAPFLYEINALSNLQFGDPLPSSFPSWLNIYDLQDFLSYIGAQVFENRVQDVLVNNKQPFPRSHGAYWTNPATWNAIIPRLP